MTLVSGGCPYCGPYTHHQGICPKVEEIEYHPNGTIKKVKFKDAERRSGQRPGIHRY